MKLSLTLNPLEKKIPIGNRYMVVSLIKKAIEKADKKLYKDIYFFEDKKNKKIKPFSFGIYLNNFKANNQCIEVNGNIVITISTADYNLGIAIYNGILKIKRGDEDKGIYKYKNYNLEIEDIKLLKESKITEDIVMLKTLSPINIKDIYGKVIAIEELDNFIKELNYISNVFLESYRGYGLIRKLEFQPINMKKMVIKEEIEEFKKITNKKYIFINAYSGTFLLAGEKEDLQLLLDCGIGFRRSEGFGLVDLI